MRNLILGLVLSLGAFFAVAHDKERSPPPAPPADTGLYFTKTDKGDHAVVGALLGLAGRLQFRESRWYAMAVPVGASALKEALDATQRGNHASGRDFLAGVVGGVLGMWAGDGLIYLTRDNGTTRVAWASTF